MDFNQLGGNVTRKMKQIIMKTFIERKLEQIRDISLDKCLSVSCDIYYDDLGVSRKEQYVVKLHDLHFAEHFRSNHIRKSLRRALKFVKSI